MSFPIRIVATDFDGTLHAEFEDPPVPVTLQEMISELQGRGVTWVVNTGRYLSSLIESIERAQLSIWPDYVVAVEREIYARKESRYLEVEDWNARSRTAHEKIFSCVRPDVPELTSWIRTRFDAKIFEDAYSPLCLIAQSSADADIIHDYLNRYCRMVPDLTVVRNHVYARLAHAAFNKGSALAEIGRHLGVDRDHIVAAGDHHNDLPMLSSSVARWLIAPSNAIGEVKATVRQQNGYVSEEPHGYGLIQGLERIIEFSDSYKGTPTCE